MKFHSFSIDFQPFGAPQRYRTAVERYRIAVEHYRTAIERIARMRYGNAF